MTQKRVEGLIYYDVDSNTYCFGTFPKEFFEDGVWQGDHVHYIFVCDHTLTFDLPENFDTVAPQPPAPAQEPSVPEGWKLVPIEPNSPMEAAAEDYWNGLRYSAFSKSPRTWAGVYGSMLEAAPKFGEEE